MRVGPPRPSAWQPGRARGTSWPAASECVQHMELRAGRPRAAALRPMPRPALVLAPWR